MTNKKETHLEILLDLRSDMKYVRKDFGEFKGYCYKKFQTYDKRTDNLEQTRDRMAGAWKMIAIVFAVITGGFGAVYAVIKVVG